MQLQEHRILSRIVSNGSRQLEIDMPWKAFANHNAWNPRACEVSCFMVKTTLQEKIRAHNI